VTNTIVIPAVEHAPAKGLPARVLGVIFSPRATYANVAAHPRVLGALLFGLVVSAAAFGAFSSTQVGKDAMLDQADRTMQSMGVRLNDQAYSQLQARMTGPSTLYINGAGQIVALLVISLITAGVFIAVFNAVMGGNATFRQVYAVVTHAGILLALQSLFSFPLDYAKQSLSSPTSLAVFLPFLSEGTFAARLLGVIDLFRIWWLVNLAIGIGVLYKKRTTPIATTLLVIYAVIAFAVAAVGVALSGA
jgi:hypothetical protein